MLESECDKCGSVSKRIDTQWSEIFETPVHLYKCPICGHEHEELGE